MAAKGDLDHGWAQFLSEEEAGLAESQRQAGHGCQLDGLVQGTECCQLPIHHLRDGDRKIPMAGWALNLRMCQGDELLGSIWPGTAGVTDLNA